MQIEMEFADEKRVQELRIDGETDSTWLDVKRCGE
jgi:hypothetical protein